LFITKEGGANGFLNVASSVFLSGGGALTLSIATGGGNAGISKT
jgi:hypothetical protein